MSEERNEELDIKIIADYLKHYSALDEKQKSELIENIEDIIESNPIKMFDYIKNILNTWKFEKDDVVPLMTIYTRVVQLDEVSVKNRMGFVQKVGFILAEMDFSIDALVDIDEDECAIAWSNYLFAWMCKYNNNFSFAATYLKYFISRLKKYELERKFALLEYGELIFQGYTTTNETLPVCTILTQRAADDRGESSEKEVLSEGKKEEGSVEKYSSEAATRAFEYLYEDPDFLILLCNALSETESVNIEKVNLNISLQTFNVFYDYYVDKNPGVIRFLLLNCNGFIKAADLLELKAGELQALRTKLSAVEAPHSHRLIEKLDVVCGGLAKRALEAGIFKVPTQQPQQNSPDNLKDVGGPSLKKSGPSEA